MATPGRRTFLKGCVGAATLAAVGLPTLAQAAPADWRRYVRGPASPDVRPARVIATTGDVRNANALLKPGDGVTVLNRPKPVPPPAWPSGTTAAASSTHAPNGGDNGTPTSYDAAHTIDGDPSTFWNDDTEGAYPDVLTITAPQPVSLPGITLLSNSDGVPVDFTVDTWDGTQWQNAATITGNSAVQVAVAFAAPMSTTQVRIIVTQDQNTPQGEFTRINEIYPGIVTPVVPPSVTIDFGMNVVGYPRVAFAWASANHPGVRLAFSETTRYLTDRSDFARSDNAGGGPGTDQYAVPAAGGVWRDREGFQSGNQVHAEGLHGFRYVTITLDALATDAPAALPYGTVAIDAVALDWGAYLGTPQSYAGWFLCSDDDLNRYWYGAAYTNELVTAPFLASDCDPRQAASPSLLGKLVLQDGAKRDRDPYVGDIGVSGRTLYLTHPDAAAAARDVLADLAEHQRADGWIPPASIGNYTLPLFDYPLWWVMASWDYLLYTGERGYASGYYPNLVAVLDTWYPSVTNANGLLEKGLNGTGGYGDYAFLPRSGAITYYNAAYVQALGAAAGIADFLGNGSDANRWRARASTVAAAINGQLWDANAGAYLDSAVGPVRHAQDGNAMAVTSGVADAARAASALNYLATHTAQPYGNAFMDNDTLPGVDGASQRVYAFTSYPELVARFQTGDAGSALDQIRRTYGWMDTHDPGVTDWEGIGHGGTPYEGAYTSMAHGWSTGVLPALTNELLGAAPTSPGFATWRVAPQPGDVAWARGVLPTPHGPLSVDWSVQRSGFRLSISAPRGTRGSVTLPGGPAGVVRVDGAVVHGPIDGLSGAHVITVVHG
ncbi:MAG TPA: alpha-L-rhamnosidase C-terminal domain-containing protein [Pseudonocardiaceae bacterium]|nr:alpha-L-rhamnosidase C-terminal domain-containing protein [Pseudonocardiaceae bacterium]